MTGPSITVAVTQRESFGHTKRSLESLYATAGVPFDLVYVDAGSPPAVRRLIADEASKRGFRVIRRDASLTPNEARNLALGSIDTDFVAFADNDVIFSDGWLRALLACAEETGAAVTGPLTFMEEPPFRKIHCAGGDVRVEETARGRRLYEEHRFLEKYITPKIAEQLVCCSTGLLEFHCVLVRRSVFEGTGPLDERLRSMGEHVDFCLLVREKGGLVMFEPAAVANHLLPKQFPFDLQSLPFFFARWSRTNNRESAEHFRAKWGLAPDDPVIEATHNWSNDRLLVIIPWLHPKIAAHGLRKISRIVKRCYRQVTKRAPV
jgi:GT2 family glycosyltransferase